MSTATKQQNKVPVLRFPDFKNNWETKNLSQVAKVQRGRFSPRPRNDPRFYGGEMPFVQTGDVVNSGEYIKNYTQTLNDDGVKVSKVFPKGSILITIAANIGYTGILAEDMACPDSLIGLIPNADMSNRYLNYYLSTQREHMDRVASVGAQKNINIDFLNPYPVSWTVLPEQQKIADFLGSVDAWLDNLRQQKTTLETYKRGMMQKLFTKQIRFKDEFGQDYSEWVEKKLGDIAKTTTGESNRDASSVEGEYIFFDRSMDVRKSDIYLFESEAIIVAGEGLKFAPRYFNGKFDLHQRAYAILNKEKTNNWRYLYYYIHYHCNYFRKMAVGTTMPSLRLPVFTAMPVSIPESAEQQKIADFLTALDESITAKTTEITKAEQWKTGLMQKMFV